MMGKYNDCRIHVTCGCLSDVNRVISGSWPFFKLLAILPQNACISFLRVPLRPWFEESFNIEAINPDAH